MAAADLCMWVQRGPTDEVELRQMMAKKFKGLSEAKQARQALEAELAEVRGQMAARTAKLEADRDASAAQAQARPPVPAKPDLAACLGTGVGAETDRRL